MRPTFTPAKVTPKMEAWAKELTQFTPRFVECHAIGPSDRYLLNVRDFTEQHGGQIVYGWMLRENGMYVIGEFHAIVRHRGKTFCVTKNDENVKAILFVEDKMRQPRMTVISKNTIVHTFHSIMYPETRPATRMQVLDDSLLPPIPMELKELDRSMSAYKYHRPSLAKI